MEDLKFEIECNKRSEFLSVSQRWDQCRGAHANLHAAAFGKARYLDDWIVLDDCLLMAYDDMMAKIARMEEQEI